MTVPARPFVPYPLRPVRVWGAPDLWTALLFALPVLGAYLVTLQAGVGWWDSGELIAAVRELSVAHRPGFPLYVVAGRALFGWLPHPALFANLFSAASATVALVLFWRGFALLARARKARPWWICAGGWLVGFAPLFWRQAVRAEVYAPVMMLAGAAFLLAASAQRAPDPRYALRRFVAAGYVAGLAFCLHSAMAVMFLPPLLYLFLAGDYRPFPRHWLWGSAAFLLGVSVYLYVPLRAPLAPYVWGDPATLSGFASYLAAGDALGQIAADAGDTPARLYALVGVLATEVPAVLLLGGLAGVAAGALSLRTIRGAALILFVWAGTVAATVVSTVIADNFDLQAYLAPLAVALWWGWNDLDPTARLAARWRAGRVRYAAIAFALVLLVACAFSFQRGREAVAPLRLGVAQMWGKALLAGTVGNELIILQDANTDFLIRGLLADRPDLPRPAVLNTAFAPASWYRSWWVARHLPDAAVRTAAPDWTRRIAAQWRAAKGPVLVDYGADGFGAFELAPSGWLARWDTVPDPSTSVPRFGFAAASWDPDWVRTAVWYYYRLGRYYRARGLHEGAASAWAEGLRWAPGESTLRTLKAELESGRHARQVGDGSGDG